MPVKQTVPYDSGLFFITFTCYQWKPLIALTNSYDVVYKWFDYLKQKGHFITGYVIMPNHLHALIGFRKNEKGINRIIGEGKRFAAYEIIKRLSLQNEAALLVELGEAVETTEKRKGKKHEVWEPSFDWKECRTELFLNQKLEYMHANPCAGKWNLTKSPTEYDHSSSRFYATGEQNFYPVTHVGELADVDLAKKFE